MKNKLYCLSCGGLAEDEGDGHWWCERCFMGGFGEFSGKPPDSSHQQDSGHDDSDEKCTVCDAPLIEEATIPVDQVPYELVSFRDTFVRKVDAAQYQAEFEARPRHGVKAKNPRVVRNADSPSRNAPCHCGSGRKYKRCHLKLELAELWKRERSQ